MSSKREVRVKPSLPVFRHQWEISVGDFSYLLSPGGKHGVPQIEVKDHKKQLIAEEDEDSDSENIYCEMPYPCQPDLDPPDQHLVHHCPDLDPSDLHLVDPGQPDLDPPGGKHGVPQIEVKDHKKQSSTEEDEDSDSENYYCAMPYLTDRLADPCQPDLDPPDLHLVDPCLPDLDPSDLHLVDPGQPDLDPPDLHLADPGQPDLDPPDLHLVDPGQHDPDIRGHDQSQKKVEYYIRQRKLEVTGLSYLSKTAEKEEFEKRQSRMKSGPFLSGSTAEMDQYEEISKRLPKISESLTQNEEFTFSVEVEDDVAGFTTKTDETINQVVNLLNDRPAALADEMDFDEWSKSRNDFAEKALELKVPFVSPDHSWADRVPISCDELSYQFTSWLIVGRDEGDERIVKLGRKPILLPIAHHWAIQVGDKWYEIIQKNWETRRNAVNICIGYAAISTAGKFGGELVGKSTKTDKMIITWLNMWLALNPFYNLLSDNCQKFSYEFMVWLTDHNYLCDHRVDAGNINTFVLRNGLISRSAIAASKGGNFIYHINSGENNMTTVGPFNKKTKGANLTAQAVAGPGLGVFLDVGHSDTSVSIGNLIGLHIGLNANTGIGARNGNLEAHLAGFGGKVGADGIEINTPAGGVNICSLM